MVGGHFRLACTLPCCIVAEVHGDTDSEWDTSVEEPSDTSSIPESDSPRVLESVVDLETESEAEVVD